MRKLLLILSVVAVAGLLVIPIRMLTSSGEPTPTIPPAPTPSPTPEPKITHPLTGEEYPEGQDWESRGALAVKIGNSGAERPQTGLNSADLIFEELAEGGITRFMAVFHSAEPKQIGNVRSIREVDPDLLSPLHALFAYAGGVPPVVSNLRKTSGVTDVGVDRLTDAYDRVRGRKAPYNLFLDPAKVWREVQGEAPPAQFEFSGDEPSGERITDARFSFSGKFWTTWTWDGKRFERSNDGRPHNTDDGVLWTDNVLFQFVSTRAGSTIDANGSRTVDTVVTGEGEAMLLRDGQLLRGRWTRSGSEPAKFTTDSGETLLLKPGRTFIELLPRDRDVEVTRYDATSSASPVS